MDHYCRLNLPVLCSSNANLSISLIAYLRMVIRVRTVIAQDYGKEDVVKVKFRLNEYKHVIMTVKMQ